MAVIVRPLPTTASERDLPDAGRHHRNADLNPRRGALRLSRRLPPPAPCARPTTALCRTRTATGAAAPTSQCIVRARRMARPAHEVAVSGPPRRQREHVDALP